MQGHPRLVNAIAALYSKLIGREINPFKEVLITSGAYEALFATISGHISPGDEAIIIEPFFDCYVPMVKTCGGVPVLIPLKSVSSILIKDHAFRKNMNLNFYYHSIYKIISFFYFNRKKLQEK